MQTNKPNGERVAIQMPWRAKRYERAVCHLGCRVDAGAPVEQQLYNVEVAILRCSDEDRPSVLGRRRQKTDAGSGKGLRCISTGNSRPYAADT